MQGVLRTSKIGSKNRLSIPDWIRENIIYDHPLFGESIEWYYDNIYEVGVAASERLDNFTHIRRTSVINGGSNIRPPQALVDNLENFGEGGRAAVFYSEHFKGDLVYFFTEETFFNQIEEGDSSFIFGQ
jgi:hypothetical protein